MGYNDTTVSKQIGYKYIGDTFFSLNSSRLCVCVHVTLWGLMHQVEY